MNKLKANALINYLNDLFPINIATPWDKVGLQIEEVYNLKSQDELQHIVICLDVTKDVIEYAIKNNSNFIISRHPFLFLEFEEEMKNPGKKELYDMCIENEIQIYSIHTNYDASDKQNIIELMEEHLNIKETKKIGFENEGYKIKFLRPITIKYLIEKFKIIFNKKNILISKNANLENEISKIYFTSGSGASTMMDLQLHDTFFVTGEAKWNEWLYASENNIVMLTLGHYMENHFIYDIEKKLKKNFGSDIKISAFDIQNTFLVL